MDGLARSEIFSNHGDRKSLAKRNAGRYYGHIGFLKLIIHCYGVLSDLFGPYYSFGLIGGTASAAVFLCQHDACCARSSWMIVEKNWLT